MRSPPRGSLRIGVRVTARSPLIPDDGTQLGAEKLVGRSRSAERLQVEFGSGGFWAEAECELRGGFVE